MNERMNDTDTRLLMSGVISINNTGYWAGVQSVSALYAGLTLLSDHCNSTRLYI